MADQDLGNGYVRFVDRNIDVCIWQKSIAEGSDAVRWNCGRAFDERLQVHSDGGGYVRLLPATAVCAWM